MKEVGKKERERDGEGTREGETERGEKDMFKSCELRHRWKNGTEGI